MNSFSLTVSTVHRCHYCGLSCPSQATAGHRGDRPRPERLTALAAQPEQGHQAGARIILRQRLGSPHCSAQPHKRTTGDGCSSLAGELTSSISNNRTIPPPPRLAI
jgi:hypothetical protein